MLLQATVTLSSLVGKGDGAAARHARVPHECPVGGQGLRLTGSSGAG